MAAAFQLPTAEDVLHACAKLTGVAVETPLLQSEILNCVTGASIWVKCENLQRTGAFKFRGAYNCLSRLDKKAYPGGVVAYSTGNHGQAIAAVGRMLDIPTTVVMPSDAPAVKIAKAQQNGAHVVLYDRRTQSREKIAAEIAAQAPVAVIPPGDNPYIIAGQGTAIVESLRQLGTNSIDIAMVPCGGGVLAAGTILGLEAKKSNAEVWAVEPHQFDDIRRSLAAGSRQVNNQLTGSICDALLASTPAELPFAIIQHRLSKVLTATDKDVLRAIRFAFDELRLVVEPGGIIALASLLNARDAVRGKRVLLLISGGTVEIDVFKRALDTTADFSAAA